MIQEIDLEQDLTWDNTVGTWSDSSVFHTCRWQRVLRDAYGYASCSLEGVFEEGNRALFPLMEVKSLFTGNRGISLPFTDSCPSLGDHDSRSKLFRAARDLGRDRKWRYLEVRGGPAPSPDANPSVSYYGHQVVLYDDCSRMMRSIESGHRRAIRKAENNSVRIEWSQSLRALKRFYSLFCVTRQRHGLPPQPWKFFAALHRNVLALGHGFVALADVEGKSRAGAIFLHFRDRAIYKFGASDPAFQHLRLNNLVMWSAFQDYGSKGFQLLDLGRTSLRNQGLRRFKLGWGTNETQINYFKYDYRLRDFTSARDDSSGWHTRFFQRIPRPIAKIIGSILYKHIA